MNVLLKISDIKSKPLKNISSKKNILIFNNYNDNNNTI
jgi:hypothetical protein